MIKIKESSKSENKLQKPNLFNVIMLNDNFTSMDFVVGVLEQIFNKSHQEAVSIMLTIHNSGSAVCGLYPYDIAVTKIEMVHYAASKSNFPLKCILKPEV